MSIKVKLNDGSIREVEESLTLLDLAKSINRNLAKKAIVGEVNNTLVDLNYMLKDNDEVNILTADNDNAIEVIRHSTSHIMAQAVKRLYNDAKLAIGPSIENGFYYDFDIEEPLTNEDLQKIENEMNNIINENLQFERFEVSREEALKIMEENNESYKIELINDLPQGEKISLYRQGEYVDLCRGPHIPSTKYVKAYKLTSVNGAYWRGNEKNKMLQRIYGVAFKNKELLEKHLSNIEEAKKMFSNMKEPYLYKGIILKDKLDYAGAKVEINEYLRRGGEQTPEIEMLMNDIENVTTYEKAISLIEEAPEKSIGMFLSLLGHFEENPLIYYYLGVCYRRIKQYEKAIYYLLESLRIESGILEVVNELGLNYACIGDYEEAIKYFKKAFEASREVEICTNIIMCYLNTGNLKDAKLHLEIAKKLDKDDEIVKKIEKVIEKREGK